MPAPDDLFISLEDSGGEGRWVARTREGPDSEMTFTRRPDGAIVIDHTRVPAALEGRGIARLLVERGVADARARGWKIVPVCSYVAAQFERRPEWADLRA